MASRIGVVVQIVITALLLTACTGGGGGAAADLPAGPELLKKAAQAMRTVKSAAFTIDTEGEPPVPVRKADGRLTAEGDADGTIQIEILGTLQELEFVLLGDTVHFKGPTGGFQRMTRAELARIYDPSAILSADKGVPALLASAADATTEGEEEVAGVGAYRVTATLSQQALAPLVPGISEGVDGTLWIDKASGRLVRASLPLGEGDASGTVIVTIGEYDAPVKVTAPK